MVSPVPIIKQLQDRNITQGDIHRATGLSRALVSLVLAGKRRSGHKAGQVMAYVAQVLDTNLESLFPKDARQRGWKKREHTPNRGSHVV